MRLYPETALTQLEFDKVRTLLESHCKTLHAREKAAHLRIHTRIEYIRLELQQTFEFKSILQQAQYFPNDFTLPLQQELRLLAIPGALITGEQWLQIRKLSENTANIFRWFDTERRQAFPAMAQVIKDVYYEKTIIEMIDEVIDEQGNVKDNASPDLQKIRMNLYRKRNELRRMFEKVIAKLAKAGYTADIDESFSNGRRVVAVFSVIEGFSWALQLSVVSNFLKETILRVLTSILIGLFYFKWISFSTFIYLFAFQYLVIFLFLFVYLLRSGHLHFHFKISRVTRKFWKKILSMQVLIYGGTLIASVAATIDSFIIAGFQGLTAVGIFVFAQFTANVIQVPQRSIQAVSSSFLSRAWKDKNYPEIHRIYSRSCINLLLMALFLFGNIWLNAEEGIKVLNIQDDYLSGLNVIFILGLVRIIDAGTGLNAMVINTSTHWRFDFISGVVLIGLRLPLTYFMIKNYGIIGSAYAELIAYATYNFIRYEFLRRKFNMQPFSLKTLYSLILAVAAYFICHQVFGSLGGWIEIICNGIVFSSIMIAGVFFFKLTPDAMQLYDVVKKRWNS